MREYTAADMEWMLAYLTATEMILDMMGDSELGSDFTYFMHLIQVGHSYETGELDSQ